MRAPHTLSLPLGPLTPEDVAVPGAPRPIRLLRVDDPAAQKRILRILGKLTYAPSKTGCTATPRFPGPNPISIDRSHLPLLSQQPYWICEKTDGLRFAWLCCRIAPPGTGEALDDADETQSAEGHGVNISVLIDRKLTCYLFPLQAIATAQFQGTVLDGELAFDLSRQAFSFQVFDALIVSGIGLFNRTFSDRIAVAVQILALSCPHPASDPAHVGVKAFVPGTDFQQYRAHLATISARFQVDGAILTPQYGDIIYGRHLRMFKWKEQHSVDFAVGTGGKLAVYDFDTGCMADVATFRNGEQLAPTGSIAECVCAPSALATAQWDLLGVRADKDRANDMFTYSKTLVNIREDLKLEELERALAVGAEAAR